jgi:hypothetical protein
MRIVIWIFACTCSLGSAKDAALHGLKNALNELMRYLSTHETFNADALWERRHSKGRFRSVCSDRHGADENGVSQWSLGSIEPRRRARRQKRSRQSRPNRSHKRSDSSSALLSKPLGTTATQNKCPSLSRLVFRYSSVLSTTGAMIGARSTTSIPAFSSAATFSGLFDNNRTRRTPK